MTLFTALVVGALWTPVRPGVWSYETQMSVDGPLAPVRVVAVRFDPRHVMFSLDPSRDQTDPHGWTTDRMPPAAVAAFNAGQFTGRSPWGWLVLDGHEAQPPGTGSAAMAFIVTKDGAASLVGPDELVAARRQAWFAFQSYPALIVGHAATPRELQAAGRGVDLEHRDSRLALGVLADGSVVVALTRFSAMGSAGETLPWGPTVGEMAAFMRGIGCVRAVLLDGGISSQLALRGPDGAVRRWTNWRAVPLGLVVTPRGRSGR